MGEFRLVPDDIHKAAAERSARLNDDRGRIIALKAQTDAEAGKRKFVVSGAQAGGNISTTGLESVPQIDPKENLHSLPTSRLDVRSWFPKLR